MNTPTPTPTPTPLSTLTIEEFIAKHEPCHLGAKWLLSLNTPTMEQAWFVCDQSPWMWWFLGKLKLAPKKLSIKYAQGCAEHVKHLKNNNAAAADTFAAHTAATAAAAHATYATFAADATAYATDAAIYAAAAAAYAADADAANADATAAAAADAAYAAERKWQAEFLRTLINPFTNHN